MAFQKAIIELPSKGVYSKSNQANLPRGYSQYLVNLAINIERLKLRKPYQSMGMYGYYSIGNRYLRFNKKFFEKHPTSSTYRTKYNYDPIPIDRGSLKTFLTFGIMIYTSSWWDFLYHTVDIKELLNTGYFYHLLQRSNIANKKDAISGVSPPTIVEDLEDEITNHPQGLKKYTTLKEKKEAVIEICNYNSVFFRGKFYTNIPQRDIQKYGKYQSSNDKLGGTSVDWIITGLDAAESKAIWLETYGLMVYRENYLIVYGKGTAFYFSNSDPDKTFEFSKINVNFSKGQVPGLSIVTIFSHLIYKRDNDSENVYCVCTQGREILVYSYRVDNIRQHKRLYDITLPSALAGKDAWCLAHNGQKLLVLRNGLYYLSSNEITEAEPFKDLHELGECNFAKIVYSPIERIYILELFYVNSDLTVDSSKYMASQDVMAWSKMSLGSDTVTFEGDKINRESDLPLLISDRGPPLFSLSGREVDLPSGVKCDLGGMRYNQIIWYTDTLFQYQPKDYFLCWNKKNNEPTINFYPISFAFNTPILTDNKNEFIDIKSLELNATLTNGEMIFYSMSPDSAHPEGNSISIPLNRESSSGYVPPDIDLGFPNNVDGNSHRYSYILKRTFAFKKVEKEVYFYIKGYADSNLEICRLIAVINLQDKE